MNQKSRLIKKLFSDRLKREELIELSEMDLLDRTFKQQWKAYNAEEAIQERIDPVIGDYIWKRILKEYKTRSKRRHMRRVQYSLAAACVALVAVIGGWLYYVNGDFFEKEKYIEVVAGRNMLYLLPDSSEVWMYPNSSIRFAENFDKNRKVWLEGSSMFHVRKLDGKTFKVYFDEAFIEVKGTKFLVDEKAPEDKEITLFEGAIDFNIETTGEQVAMNPMEKIYYNPLSAAIIVEKIDHIECQDDRFKFNAMPLKDLISIINQMYHTNIVYEGKDAMAPFSGTIYQDTPLDEIIQKICFLMNLKEERAGSEIIIKN